MTSPPAPSPRRPSPLRVGVVCYPTLGGSGIVATELGLAMAERGHRVAFISYDLPRRFATGAGVTFHSVVVPDYPVFHHAPYALALASKIIEVARWEQLDLVHVHYALPHATSAFLARAVLGPAAPPVITTVHGTDVTLVGTDASYLPITRFSLEQSQAVTAPSEFLARTTRERLSLGDGTPVHVIPNFVDPDRYTPPEARPAGPPVVIHVSNFRPVKRVLDVIEVFARVAAKRPCRLVMVGDGPDRSRAEARTRALGLRDHVRFLGKQDQVVEALRAADVMLLPSETESFGLAALEAASCGVPAVATRTGGLPEVVVDGETGLLAPVGDLDALAAHVGALLDDPATRRRMGAAARARVLERFARDPTVDRYEALYRQVVVAAPDAVTP